ncbi:hypothetical protein C8J57DRAFT_102068 [Mycena rebaudengoi]|nr:hypothetical protein C8J57DRAFT_102068 [Mycena rebaudengoi]
MVETCAPALSEQGPIIAHDLRSISPFGKTVTKLCEATFGLCQPFPVNKYTVPMPKVVHFSDVHIDRQYLSGSEANCKKPICCRAFADEAKPPVEPAGPFSNRNCDSPGWHKLVLQYREVRKFLL